MNEAQNNGLRQTLSLKVKREFLEMLDERAAALGITRPQLIRTILVEGLKHE